jgi:LPS sulfotransferase NodH
MEVLTIGDVRPHTSYVICATSRSGSTLLCDRLMATGFAGRPEEYFNARPRAALGHPVWSGWDRADMAAYVGWILDLGTTPNGVFGVKLTPSALEALLVRLRADRQDPDMSDGELLGMSFPGLRFLWITRRDKVRQAISAYRALQSDTWIERTGTAHRAEEPSYSFVLIDEQVGAIVQDEAAWSHFFTANGIRPHTVVYEDLVADTEDEVNAVLRWLGIDCDLSGLRAAGLSKQADRLTNLWEQRYYADKGRQRRRRLARTLPSLVLRTSLRRAYLRPPLKRRAAAIVKRITRFSGRATG